VTDAVTISITARCSNIAPELHICGITYLQYTIADKRLVASREVTLFVDLDEKMLQKPFLSSTVSQPFRQRYLERSKPLPFLAPILESSYGIAMPIQIASPANNLTGTGETVES
jgi:hypothetical protein